MPGSEVWNFDPKLLAGLALAGLCFYGFSKRAHARDKWRSAYLLSGLVVLALAFVSPLCNLSVALFSARATQHMIVALIAAPLIAKALAAGNAEDRSPGHATPLAATLIFAAVFWFWHSPAAYDETLRSNGVYWLMHLSTFGAALFLWLLAFRSNELAAFMVVTVTGLQMTLLGALLTFAAQPLFSVHEFTTPAWGLTSLQDQELGGLVMWVPAGLLLTGYSVFALGRLLSRMDAADRLQAKSSA
ncbi:MAG: cytochrome c oxidase assembly protein [Hyphomicrobiales bacterium]|nr:cytochrome c oxidase assembly protein [Hyphomicrobiales bacterium]